MKASTSHLTIYKIISVLLKSVMLSLFIVITSGADVLLAKASGSESKGSTCGSIHNVSVRIICTGDIMMHKSILNAAKTNTTKKYNFQPVLDIVSPLLRQGDITIGNLETVFAGDEFGFSGYPDFNSPQVLASDLKAAGFTILTTSNNHSFDKGIKGLKKTIQVLKIAGLNHTGTFEDTADKKRSIILDVNGCRIGLISYTYGINGELSSRIKKHINLIDTVNIKIDIDSLQKEAVDIIVASVHFGNEYRMVPSERQKKLVKFLWNNGVHIVFGHHPHVLQPFVYDSAANRFAVFSLGNFISSQHGDNKEYGGIADITIEKTIKDPSFHITAATVHPTCIIKLLHKSRYTYRIFNLDNPDKTHYSLRIQRHFSLKADTISFFQSHLHSLDGIFSYADNTKTIASDGGR